MQQHGRKYFASPFIFSSPFAQDESLSHCDWIWSSMHQAGGGGKGDSDIYVGSGLFFWFKMFDFGFQFFWGFSEK